MRSEGTSRFLRLAPFLVLGIGLLSTGLISWHLVRVTRSADQERMENAAHGVARTIEDRMGHYTSLLRAGAALFVLDRDLTEAGLREFVAGLHLARDYPGIPGLGFARRVPGVDREAFIERMRSRDPSFDLWPTTVREEHFPIVFFEPAGTHGRAAIGYDMFSESKLRGAMIQAREQAAAVASGRVETETLGQESAGSFLILVPAYRQRGEFQSKAEREESFVGFVFSPFRGDHLMQGIFRYAGSPRVQFRVYDGQPAPGNLIYASPGVGDHEPLFSVTDRMEIVGRTWTLVSTSTPFLEMNPARRWVPWISGAGLGFTFILFGITRALTVSAARARRSQREEAEQRERLRVTLASIGDGVIASDDDGRVDFMNPVAEALTGWSLGDAQNRPLMDVARIEEEDTGQPVTDLVDRVLNEEKVVEPKKPSVLVSRNGRKRPIADSAAPIREGGGDVMGVVVVFRDVTEKREADRALRESEARSTAILDAALDAIVTGNEKGEVVEWNPAAARIFGYGREEAVGRELATLIVPPQQRENYSEHLGRCLRTGAFTEGGVRFEMPAVCKDGRELVTEVALTCIPIQGSPLFTAYVRDITASKQAASELGQAREEIGRYAEKLEETVAERTAELQNLVGELEAFSYSISHDMRAPLRAIHGMAQVLLEDYGGKVGPQGIDYLNRLITSAARLDNLIQDVLSYSRLIRSDIELKPIELGKLLREIIRQYPEFEPPRAEVEIREPLMDVMGQEASLTQCISNLLSNAVKFVPSGATPRVEIWTERVDGNVRLCVKDNGIGIDPLYHDRIFRIFERIHPQKMYSGTGIGLAIVRKAVERMKGGVGLESEVGKGSTFWIELPAAGGGR